jgi:putative transposase
MKNCQWARLLAYVTGMVNQELLLQVEYLAAENRILRAHAPARLRLSNEERSTLGEIRKRLGRKALAKVSPRRQTGYHPRLVRETGGAEV